MIESNIAMKTPPLPRHSKKAGFSLVEVMIAAWILSVAFAALFGAVGQGMKMIEYSRDVTRVSQILMSEMEELRTLNFTDLEAMRDGSGWYSVYKPDTEFNTEYNERYTVYRYVWTHPVDSANMIRVILYVTWTAPGSGGWHYRMLTTDFTENGLNDYYYRNV